MSLRLAAAVLASLFVCGLNSPSVRADTVDDDISQMQLIHDAAIDVQASVDDLKSALLADGDPNVRPVFSLLNNLHARAFQIETVSYSMLGDMNGQDIEAIAFLVLMQAARSAQDDLKVIMNDVQEINGAMARQHRTFVLLQQQEHIAAATEAVVKSTDNLLDLFGLTCVFCD